MVYRTKKAAFAFGLLIGLLLFTGLISYGSGDSASITAKITFSIPEKAEVSIESIDSIFAAEKNNKTNKNTSGPGKGIIGQVGSGSNVLSNEDATAGSSGGTEKAVRIQSKTSTEEASRISINIYYDDSI